MANEKEQIITENEEISTTGYEIPLKNEENPPVITETEQNNGSVSTKIINSASTVDLFSKESEKEFKNLYPSVNLEELKSNKAFSELLNTIMKNPTLSQVYECFNSIVDESEKNTREKLTHALATAEASVGALSSAYLTEQAFFTKEQVLRMTQEEIRKNYSKIRQSQQHW